MMFYFWEKENLVVGASHWQLLALLFGENSSTRSIAPNLRTEEEMQNWKERSSTGWLENGILYYLQQNSAHPSFLGLEREEGLWEETGAEDLSETLTACWPSSLFWPHTQSWLSKWGPGTQSVLSIFSVTFINGSAALCLVWGKHCVSAASVCICSLKQCRGVRCALCWLSEKLQQTLPNRLK